MALVALNGAHDGRARLDLLFVHQCGTDIALFADRFPSYGGETTPAL